MLLRPRPPSLGPRLSIRKQYCLATLSVVLAMAKRLNSDTKASQLGKEFHSPRDFPRTPEILALRTTEAYREAVERHDGF